MDSFKYRPTKKKTIGKDLRSGGVFAIALSIPLFFVAGILALLVTLLGAFLLLASYGE